MQMQALLVGLLITNLLPSMSDENEPTKTDIEKIYESTPPGFMVCVYYGSRCKRDSQVCNPEHRSCTDIVLYSINFKDAPDVQKCDACWRFIEDNDESATQDTQFFGYYDACVYIIGKLVLQGTGCHGKGHDLTAKVGHETCLHSKTLSEQCKLGEQYCSETGCMPLFNNDTSDQEKTKYCTEIIERNVTQQLDSCIYALGLESLKGITPNTSTRTEVTTAITTTTPPIGRTEIPATKTSQTTEACDKGVSPREQWAWGLAATFFVVIITGVVAYLWKHKKLCFKAPPETLTVTVGNRNPDAVKKELIQKIDDENTCTM